MNRSKNWKFFVDDISYDKIIELREYLQENAEYYDISRMRQQDNNRVSLSGNVIFSRKISPPEVVQNIKWFRL